VTEQLQVLRQYVGLRFSRKIQLSAGKSNQRHVPPGIPSEPAGTIFRKGRGVLLGDDARKDGGV
jgi:hypothetical protein